MEAGFGHTLFLCFLEFLILPLLLWPSLTGCPVLSPGKRWARRASSFDCSEGEALSGPKHIHGTERWFQKAYWQLSSQVKRVTILAMAFNLGMLPWPEREPVWGKGWESMVQTNKQTPKTVMQAVHPESIQRPVWSYSGYSHLPQAWQSQLDPYSLLSDLHTSLVVGAPIHN